MDMWYTSFSSCAFESVDSEHLHPRDAIHKFICAVVYRPSVSILCKLNQIL